MGWPSGCPVPSAHPRLQSAPRWSATSPQCLRPAAACVCKPGFVGYKCDRCQNNFFLTASGTRYRGCPPCYALVKEEVSPPRRGPAQARLFISCPQRAPALCWALQEVPAYPEPLVFLGPRPPSSCAHPAIWLSSPSPLSQLLSGQEKWPQPCVLPTTRPDLTLLTFPGDEDTGGP